jgi:hypothetical protein
MSKRDFFYAGNVSKYLQNRRSGRTGHTLAGLAAAAAALLAGGCDGPVHRAAHQTWLQKRGAATVVVTPVIVRQGQTTTHDADAAAAIVEFVNTKGFGTATAVDATITPGPWLTNQSQMLAESAAKIGEWRKAQAVTADYVVTAEALFLGGTGEPHGVHLYVVDAEGRLADAVLLNTHHDIFRTRKSKEVNACVSIALDAWKMDYPDEPAK